MLEYPTPWQRKTLWSALTAVAVVTIGALAVGLVWLISRVLGFLQPILTPFAVAGVLAYLLEPFVSRIVGLGTSRHRAVFAVFALVTISFAGILVWIVPAISSQSVNLARKVPGYTQRTRELLVGLASDMQARYGISVLPQWSGKAEEGTNPPSPMQMKSVEAVPGTPGTLASPRLATPDFDVLQPADAGAPIAETADAPLELQQLLSGDWLQGALLTIGKNSWNLIRSSVGGFLGVLGFILSLVIVPVYLYYFLIESRTISDTWQDYVPIRASAFKDEVVAVLSEINGYLIAFFRGQLVVSLINGTATGILLVAIGLDFGLLIGLALCLLGIIPYLGIILSWIPAVVIASVQGGSWLIPATAPWWLFPAVVTAIFVVVQQIDGLFITPKIVGESVGLHPMTIIVSVFAWSLLMGGLLGAILAVPMTATLKVLLKRYVWERRFGAEQRIITEESFALQQALERAEPPAMMGK